MGQLADALMSKGYNSTDALNAEKGPRASELSREYLGGSSGQSSGQSSSGGGSSVGDLGSYLKQQQELQQQAIAPAVQSLQAGIPTIQKNFQAQIGQKQAEIQPLQDRYKALLDQIKGVGQTSVNKQTVVTANELGKRGIEGSSSLAGQEIASATLPIEQQTQGLVKDTGFAQEADIRDINNTIQNLGGQQTERENAVTQAISQLQSGGGQTAISNALSLLNNAQQMQSASETNAATQRQQEIENALAQAQLGNQTSLNQANIKNINSQIAERGTNNSNPGGIASYYGNNVTNTNGNVQSSSKGTWIPQGDWSF